MGSGSTFSLLLLISFILLGMSAIQGEGAVAAAINSAMVGGAAAGNGSGKPDGADGGSAVVAKLMEMLERNLKDTVDTFDSGTQASKLVSKISKELESQHLQ